MPGTLRQWLYKRTCTQIAHGLAHTVSSAKQASGQLRNNQQPRICCMLTLGVRLRRKHVHARAGNYKSQRQARHGPGTRRGHAHFQANTKQARCKKKTTTTHTVLIIKAHKITLRIRHLLVVRRACARTHTPCQALLTRACKRGHAAGESDDDADCCIADCKNFRKQCPRPRKGLGEIRNSQVCTSAAAAVEQSSTVGLGGERARASYAPSVATCLACAQLFSTANTSHTICRQSLTHGHAVWLGRCGRDIDRAKHLGCAC